ncbi:MAG: 3-deoxy-manno-octulosonate cytidylyltransferase [Synergistaceae bacterium]|jgi:3-deoxy-manno-octulosonate cytidylyltransferase (CMP-KDO synthetase)|nr:3-deoxy-manno-octulosonate cytidylyltransferase [Synergistaceae bacterium]
MIETLAVIPARHGSTRLPGKPLVKLHGKELALRVWEGARRSALVDRLIVATDHEPIARLVERAGGEAMMTPENLATGNDRVAWVAERVPSRFVVNVQGDNPLVSPEILDPLIAALREDPEVTLVVPAKRIDTREESERNSVVKMVFDEKGRALYFSRSVIPFSNDPAVVRFKHVGIYAWRRDALFEFASWPRSPLEMAESLEMLRLLEKGRIIRCVQTDAETIEIDTPDDVLLFEDFFSRCAADSSAT